MVSFHLSLLTILQKDFRQQVWLVIKSFAGWSLFSSSAGLRVQGMALVSELEERVSQGRSVSSSRVSENGSKMIGIQQALVDLETYTRRKWEILIPWNDGAHFFLAADMETIFRSTTLRAIEFTLIKSLMKTMMDEQASKVRYAGLI